LLKLLARLEGRSSLKNLEPNLFAEEGSPVHGKNVSLTYLCKNVNVKVVMKEVTELNGKEHIL